MNTKAQWKAIYDFCDAMYCTPRELIAELRENGTVAPSTKINELGEYVTLKDYDTMFKFLEEHL